MHLTISLCDSACAVESGPFCSRPAGFPGAALGVFLLLAAATAGAQQPGYRVDIDAPDPLTALLRANLDIVRWSARENVSDDQLRQLVKSAPEQARKLLATEGYFSPRVEAALTGDAGARIARLKVELGEPTRVSAIEVRIGGAIDSDPQRQQRIERARDAFKLKEGDIFRQADWEDGKQGMLRAMHRKRYAAARIVSSRANIDPGKKQARLYVEIDSGPAFRFGKISAVGLERYEHSIVTNLSPIRPGDPYDEEQLLKFQNRLLVSGYFASAVVTAGADPERADATPVYVNVVEAAARKVEFGIGYSTDRGARFQAEYTDKNALDRAWRLSSHLKVDRLSQQVVGGLTFPRRESGWHYGLEGKFNNQDIQGERRTDWSVTGARTFVIEERESQLSLQVLNENRLLEGGTEDNRKATFLNQSWSWNSLDDRLAPRSGYSIRLQGGGAAREVGSDRSFGRVLAKGTYLQPVSTFGTLLVRLEIGAVLSDTRDNIPSAYLFRTGGDTTVRGYAFESLGVREANAITGGRYLAVGSIEYVQWLSDQWGAAVFYDAGNAVDEPADYRAAQGYGAGARWRSPIGALSLDLAYGKDEREFRVHFSAGFAF